MNTLLRVLVVEDDPVQALMLTLMLAHLGASAQVATDGAQAVEAVHASRFDLVLMDYVMPGVNGIEATRRIRRWEAESHADPVRIVALTASGMADECQRYRDAGMDDVMLKPVSTAALAEVLTAHVAYTLPVGPVTTHTLGAMP